MNHPAVYYPAYVDYYTGRVRLVGRRPHRSYAVAINKFMAFYSFRPGVAEGRTFKIFLN